MNSQAQASEPPQVGGEFEIDRFESATQQEFRLE